MRLSAIFFPNASVEHIFGKNHPPQLINLGGKFIFNFTQDKEELNIDLEPNTNFIQNFWGENLNLVSSIVGANGIGKTSILRAINHSIDERSKKTIKIYESITDDHVFFIENQTDFEVSFPKEKKYDFKILDGKESIIQPLYYSPVLDYDLVDTKSPIALVNTYTKTLTDFYLDSISRNIIFLNDSITNDLKSVYGDFPTYDELYINVHAPRKDGITQVYAQANFATPHRGDALINEINRDIRVYKRNISSSVSHENIINRLEGYIGILKSESFLEQFQKLWDLNEYKTVNEQHLIHNSDNFLKDIEISVLSYLLLGAVFPQTGLGSGFPFENIIEKNEFEDKLDTFLKYYLVNQYEDLALKIQDDLDSIKVIDADKIIAIINKDKFSQLGGINTDSIKKSMIKDVKGFKDIFDFHRWLKNNIGSQNIKIINNKLTFQLESLNLSLFDTFLVFANKISRYFSSLPIEVKLFDITPNKKLSSGEKSLLNFYSSLFNYIQKGLDSQNFQFENYLLLLDEPELGYHPLWKKKFVLALTKTLPVLFKKLNLKKDPPNLQVIFTTHDPLTLSDLPNQNIVYLSKDISNNTGISLAKNFKSFGANISDLLADSFFIDDGLMGDFAKDKIDETIDWLNAENKDGSEIHYKVIQTIDEPLIQKKLLEMFDHKMQTENLKMLEQEEIEKMIRNYENKHGKLDL